MRLGSLFKSRDRAGLRVRHVTLEQNHIATTFTLRVSCGEDRAGAAERALEEAHAIIARLESELSEFLPESPVFKLNHAPPGARIAMPPSALELLSRSESLRKATEGAFDCTA